MRVEDKTIRLKHLGLVLNQLTVSVLAPVVEQVADNLQRIQALESSAFMRLTADDTTETMIVSINDDSEEND